MEGYLTRFRFSTREVRTVSMSRVFLALVFFVSSTALIAVSAFGGMTGPMREILGDLGTEIFGILVTIALVDWYLEKRRRQDRARELAWNVLHAIEHAVWVWQGGPRHMGTNELLGIVSGVQKGDDLKPFTEGLMMNIGLQSRSIGQKEPAVVKSIPGLREILADLVSLATLRDFPDSTRIRTVAEILEASVTGLARVLGQPTDRMPAGLIWYRDSSKDGQEERYQRAAPRTPEGLMGLPMPLPADGGGSGLADAGLVKSD